MDALADLITAPVQPWDALICTSQAVKQNVERLLQAEVDRLVQRLGITRLVLPQLPVIPLGIVAADFQRSDSQRGQARQALALGGRAFGSPIHGAPVGSMPRAHPLAMYQALEAARIRTGKTIVLIECGWYANESIAVAFAAAARSAPLPISAWSLSMGASPKSVRRPGPPLISSAALSDNIQETFGITPIEAMAAGCRRS